MRTGVKTALSITRSSVRDNCFIIVTVTILCYVLSQGRVSLCLRAVLPSPTKSPPGLRLHAPTDHVSKTHTAKDDIDGGGDDTQQGNGYKPQ